MSKQQQQQQPQVPSPTMGESPKSVKNLTVMTCMAKVIIGALDKTFLGLNQTPCGKVTIKDFTNDSSISIISNAKQFERGFIVPEWNKVEFGTDKIGDPISQQPKTGPPLTVSNFMKGLSSEFLVKIKDSEEALKEINTQLKLYCLALIETNAKSKKYYKEYKIEHEVFDMVRYVFTLELDESDEMNQYGSINYRSYSSKAVPTTSTLKERIKAFTDVLIDSVEIAKTTGDPVTLEWEKLANGK